MVEGVKGEAPNSQRATGSDGVRYEYERVLYPWTGEPINAYDWEGKVDFDNPYGWPQFHGDLISRPGGYVPRPAIPPDYHGDPSQLWHDIDSLREIIEGQKEGWDKFTKPYIRKYSEDFSGRRVEETKDKEGEVVGLISYDAKGRKVISQSPDGERRTETVYDDEDRVVARRMVGSDGVVFHITTYHYSNDGRQVISRALWRERKYRRSQTKSGAFLSLHKTQDLFKE